MAYSFNGSSQYLSASSALNAALPWTFAGFLKKDNLTTNGNVICIADTTSSTAYYTLNARGNDGTNDNNISAQQGDASNTSLARTAGNTLQSGVWQQAASAFAAQNSRSAYVDGGNKATNTDTRNTDNALLDAIAIGVLRRSTLSEYFGGLIAECAVWSVALSDAEIASLGKGFSPRRIRPQSLLFYSPLIRTLQDLRGALSITNNNTATVADHPRVY